MRARGRETIGEREREIRETWSRSNGQERERVSCFSSCSCSLRVFPSTFNRTRAKKRAFFMPDWALTACSRASTSEKETCYLTQIVVSIASQALQLRKNKQVFFFFSVSARHQRLPPQRRVSARGSHAGTILGGRNGKRKQRRRGWERKKTNKHDNLTCAAFSLSSHVFFLFALLSLRPPSLRPS